MNLNPQNISIVLFDYVEGNLTELEIQELEAFLDKHPFYRKELDFLKAAVLSFSEEIVEFKNKEVLLAFPNKNVGNIAKRALLFVFIAFFLTAVVVVSLPSIRGYVLSPPPAENQYKERRLNFERIQDSLETLMSADNPVLDTTPALPPPSSVALDTVKQKIEVPIKAKVVEVVKKDSLVVPKKKAPKLKPKKDSIFEMPKRPIENKSEQASDSI